MLNTNNNNNSFILFQINKIKTQPPSSKSYSRRAVQKYIKINDYVDS